MMAMTNESNTPANQKMVTKRVPVALVCLILGLIVLHQDYWQWDNATLDFGFLPRSLTYHALISCVAATCWLAATRFCWIKDRPS